MQTITPKDIGKKCFVRVRYPDISLRWENMNGRIIGTRNQSVWIAFHDDIVIIPIEDVRVWDSH